MVESARIARGKVKDISALKESEYNALVIPGGLGVPKTLCEDFEIRGAECAVDPTVQKIMSTFVSQGRPILLCGITPILAARIFGAEAELTMSLGNEGCVSQKKMRQIISTIYL